MQVAQVPTAPNTYVNFPAFVLISLSLPHPLVAILFSCTFREKEASNMLLLRPLTVL